MKMVGLEMSWFAYYFVVCIISLGRSLRNKRPAGRLRVAAGRVWTRDNNDVSPKLIALDQIAILIALTDSEECMKYFRYKRICFCYKCVCLFWKVCVMYAYVWVQSTYVCVKTSKVHRPRTVLQVHVLMF